MRTLDHVEIYWAVLPIDSTGLYQILGGTLQLFLRVGADHNIVLEYIKPVLASLNIELNNSVPVFAVPAPISPQSVAWNSACRKSC